jgi:ElaB/YqjD/DUF883 family membrane-anchored ribosome-binding protein
MPDDIDQPDIETDAEGVRRQLQVVRDDVARLAGRVAEMASHKARELTGDVGHGLGGAVVAAADASRDIRTKFEASVTRNPIAAVGIAAGVGYVMALARRGR